VVGGGPIASTIIFSDEEDALVSRYSSNGVYSSPRAELGFAVGVFEPRWISAKSVRITVLRCFVNVKTPARNRKDPGNIFIWLYPCSSQSFYRIINFRGMVPFFVPGIWDIKVPPEYTISCGCS
jgi:hypothetical protein